IRPSGVRPSRGLTVAIVVHLAPTSTESSDLVGLGGKQTSRQRPANAPPFPARGRPGPRATGVGWFLPRERWSSERPEQVAPSPYTGIAILRVGPFVLVRVRK